jgi:hypothetical protein
MDVGRTAEGVSVVSGSEMLVMFVKREWSNCKESFQKYTKWYNFLGWEKKVKEDIKKFL